MFSLNFRVSTKLAIASGVSLLLVAAMLANEQFSNDSVAEAYAAALREQEVVKNTANGTAAIRNSLIALSNVRLAQTPAKVAEQMEALRGAAKDGRSRMEEARRFSSDPANQARMDKAAELFDGFAEESKAYAAARIEVLNSEAAQNDAGTKWTRAWEGMEAALAFSDANGRAELDSNLREGAQLFMDARNAYWRFVSTDDPKVAQRMTQLLLTSAAALRQARSGVTDKTMAERCEELVAVVTGSKEILEKGVKAWTTAGKVWSDKLVPDQGQRGRTGSADHRGRRTAARSGVDAAGSRMTQSGRIGLGVGLIAFRDLDRHGGVRRRCRSAGRSAGSAALLLELANGNKAVDIPFTARGDEVGDAARAANTFRDNLVQMEQLRGRAARGRGARRARKSASPRSASRRQSAPPRSRPRPSARRRCTGWPTSSRRAVGNIVETVSSASTELEAAATLADARPRRPPQQLSATVAAPRRRPRPTSVGRLGDRGDDRLGQRDQPAGAGIEQDRRRGGQAGGEDRRPHRRAVARGRAASATWSS